MKIKILIVSIILMLCLTVSVGAAGYPSYNYLENGGIAAAPQPFKVLDVLFAEDFGGSSFEEILANPVKAVLPEAEKLGVKVGMTGAEACDVLNG